MALDKKEVDALISRVREIAESKRNRNLKRNFPHVAVMVGVGRSLLIRRFGYSVVDYYDKPETRLLCYLKSKIFLHEFFEDDTIVEPSIGYDYGASGTLEAGLFGIPPVFDPVKDPFVAMEPNLKDYADLKKLRLPDFYATQPMPYIHERYKELVRLVDGRLEVTFPGWVRSHWSLALFLRGFTELYMDMLDAPDFVKELLDFLAESRISWEKQRSAFVGKAPSDPKNLFTNCYDDYRRVHVSDQYSDEVDGAMASPEMYRDLILPAELKLARFYGGIHYYHSCGNLTPFLPDLTRLPGLGMLHVSSWTDLKRARDCAPPGVILQRVLHPKDDVLHASEEHIRTQTREILATVPDRKLWICADAIYDGDVNAIKRWLGIVKEEVAKNA